MAGKISDLTAITGANLASTDKIEVVDVSDTSMALTGTNKQTTLADLAVAVNPSVTVVSTAVSDGVTNALTQVRVDLASAAGGTLLLGAGTYLLTNSAATDFLTPSANTTIRGMGKGRTILLFDAPTTAYRAAFGVYASNIRIEGCTIRRNSAFDCVMFNLAPINDVWLDDCEVDGRDLTFTSNYAHGLLFPNSGNCSNIFVTNSTFRELGFPLLMQNISTASVSKVVVDNCVFLENSGESIGANAPLATWRDFKVTNNRIVSTRGTLAISLAHIEGAVVANNYINHIGEGVHIEDYSTNVSVANNTFYECCTSAPTAQSVLQIIDSFGISVTGNTFTNTTACNVPTVVAVAGDFSGTTIGGRTRLDATRDITITGNEILSGPNRGIDLTVVSRATVTGNQIRGGLRINASTFAETGTQTTQGIYTNLADNHVIAGNSVSGFRVGIGSLMNPGARSFADGTTITGNQISECRIGIMGRSGRPFTATGNQVRQCRHPMAILAHGNGANGGGTSPYSLTGNVFTANRNRASIDGVHVVVSAGTASIGSGVSLTVEPLLTRVESGAAITFAGGGVFTLTAAALEDATTITGDLVTANIASGEAGTLTGLPDLPFSSPFTLSNRVLAANADSIVGFSDLTAITGANLASTDKIEVVDVSDTTMAATGTNKSTTLADLAASSAFTTTYVAFPSEETAQYRSGGGYVAHPIGSNWSTNNPANGTLIFISFVAPATTTIDRIGIDVSSAGTAAVSVHRLGIWANSSNAPGTLLVDAGTVATDSTGFKEITISQSVTVGTRYWLGVVQQGAPASRATIRIGLITQPVMVPSVSAGFPTYGLQSTGVTGALASTPTIAGGAGNVDGAPRIWVRYT
jgi:hypothetical protein